jgi:hypothetical protein
MTPDLEVQIPPPFSRPLQRIAEMEKADFDAFLSAVSECPLGASVGEGGDTVQRMVPSLGEEAASLVVFAVTTRRFVVTLGVTPEDVARALSVSFFTNNPEQVENLKVDREQLSQRIAAILDVRYIVIREKADRIADEGPTLITDVQIFTDARPVFSKDGDDIGDLAGYVVLNTLKVESKNESGQSAIQYLLLDRKALDKLQTKAARARSKSEMLNSELLRAGLKDLGA